MSRGDYRELDRLCKGLQNLRVDMPQLLQQLTLGEGLYCVAQARKIVKEEDKVYTGALRLNYHCGTRGGSPDHSPEPHDGSAVRLSGSGAEIDVYNNLDYASFVELGFRSHWVPARYLSPRLLAQVADQRGVAQEKVTGLYVGPHRGYVNGIFALRRAQERQQKTSAPRLLRKLEQELKERVDK